MYLHSTFQQQGDSKVLYIRHKKGIRTILKDLHSIEKEYNKIEDKDMLQFNKTE